MDQQDDGDRGQPQTSLDAQISGESGALKRPNSFYMQQVSSYWQAQFDEESVDTSGRRSLSSPSLATRVTLQHQNISQQHHAPPPPPISSSEYATTPRNGISHDYTESFPSPTKNLSQTCSSSGSSIWSKLSEDEGRKARLRNRLNQMREGTGGSSLTSGSGEGNRTGGSSIKSDASTDGSNSTSGTPRSLKPSHQSASLMPMPTQEEARRLAHHVAPRRDHFSTPALSGSEHEIPLLGSGKVSPNEQMEISQNGHASSLVPVHIPSCRRDPLRSSNPRTADSSTTIMAERSGNQSKPPSSQLEAHSTNTMASRHSSSPSRDVRSEKAALIRSAMGPSQRIIQRRSRENPRNAATSNQLAASDHTDLLPTRRRPNSLADLEQRKVEEDNALRLPRHSDSSVPNSIARNETNSTPMRGMSRHSSRSFSERRKIREEDALRQRSHQTRTDSSSDHLQNESSFHEERHVPAREAPQRQVVRQRSMAERQKLEENGLQPRRNSMDRIGHDASQHMPSSRPQRRSSDDLMNNVPGAFSVEGPEANRRGRSVSPSGRLETTSPTDSPRSLRGRFSPTSSTYDNSLLQPGRSLSSKPVMAVAAVVVEDYERQELSEKERQLKEQEEELAARMAQLQAWEEELKRQKQELEMQQNGGGRAGGVTNAFASAEVVHAAVLNEYYAPLSQRIPPTEPQRPTSGSWSVFAPSKKKPAEPKEEAPVKVDPDSMRRGQSSAAGPLDIEVNLHQAEAELGPGPLRFSLRGERSIEVQLMELPKPDKMAYKNLKQRWEDYTTKQLSTGSTKGSFEIPISWHLRYLRTYAKKDGSFMEDRAFVAEKKLRKRFLVLNAFALTKQLQSKTLFPVPGLKTAGGHAMFYMRPSRYFPGKTTTKAIIDNLCYVMNTMLEKEHAQQEGIGFIACMDDWKMKNFEINYCYQFMMALQGFMVPVKTQLFLIVNPPAWFGVIWRLMKPMLAPSFRKRVKICNEVKIAKYLAPGFEKYLPDDMSSGMANTDVLVSDFIAFRQYAERIVYGHHSVAGSSADSDCHSATSVSGKGLSEDGNIFHDSHLAHWSDAPEAAVSSVGVAALARAPPSGASTSNSSAGRDHSFDAYDDDSDLASIEADIDNEDDLSEHDDMKPSASAEFSNLPDDSIMSGRNGRRRNGSRW